MEPVTASTSPVAPTSSPTSRVDLALAAARARYRRVTAAETLEEVAAGALLVDTRPENQRREFGVIPGATPVERNVLEWRLDPTSTDRLPGATSEHRRIILYCQEGYASSLAVASLLDLGLSEVTDLAGGIKAWLEAGLPVQPTD